MIHVKHVIHPEGSVTFIIGHDIPEAIKSKSNYLAASGLSVYTELFGGFYNGLE